MSVNSQTLEPKDSRIAVAEMWLCMLAGLREIAKRYSRFLFYEIMPFGPCPQEPVLAFCAKVDPVTSLKRVIRALRFAAILCLKIQKQIEAWKAGVPFDLDAFLAQAPRLSARAAFRAGGGKGDERDWDEEEWEALDEVETLVEWEALERFDLPDRRDRPVKEDRYQALLKGPLRDAIAALCVDLGLSVDWSFWTENGFTPPLGGKLEDWVAFFSADAVSSPKRAGDGSPVDDAAYQAWRRECYPDDVRRARRPYLAAPQLPYRKEPGRPLIFNNR